MKTYDAVMLIYYFNEMQKLLNIKSHEGPIKKDDIEKLKEKFSFFIKKVEIATNNEGDK